MGLRAFQECRRAKVDLSAHAYASKRLPRFARNDVVDDRHCEEAKPTWQSRSRIDSILKGVGGFVLIAVLAFLPLGLCAGAVELEKTWAFEAPIFPDVPAVTDSAWAAQPIDAFVYAKLAELGLKPSAEESRRTLVRRVYLDVLGLPPSPEEVEAFVNNEDPQAYEQLVDSVLASPHYGERWARHWLDVVSFAETNGYETNTPRPNAWPYRDYVIEAFNKDTPYTQFIKEQLSGDALSVDAATGFLVGGAWDEVKSPDVVLTKNQRDAVLHDIVSTTASAFLGLTVGCAKCHDHKFDPISQQDYFQMRAIFAGVKHGEREVRPADYHERNRKAMKLAKSLRGVEQELDAFLPLANTAQSLFSGDGGGATRRAPVQHQLNEERITPVTTKRIRFRIAESLGGTVCIDELEVFSTGERSLNVALASEGAIAHASSEYPTNTKHRTVHINDGVYGNSYSWIPATSDGAWVEIEFAEAVEIDRITWGRDREGQFTDRLATRYAIAVEDETGEWKVVASSFDRLPFGTEFSEDDRYQVTRLDEEQRTVLTDLLAKKTELNGQRQTLLSFPKIYGGVFTEPEPTRFLYRGDPMSEGDPVAPGGVTGIQPALALDDSMPEQERRIALAEWLCAPENPLTARVMANRIWQHHFGTALVETPSDFGAMGFRPSHPELLDWLAVTFVENEWRPKALHKMILLSRTYRQSSAPRDEAAALDANNVYLWRYSPRRMDAEPIRDSVLAVSGVLDLKMGGPGYNVFEDNTNYVRVYTPKKEFGPAEWRRMVYQYKPRMEQDETFGIFDCPDGAQQQPKRNRSTTPLQALNLMNSPFMNQQAELFANRLTDEAGDASSAQVQQAFRLAFGREADEAELTRSVGFIESQGLTMFCRALYNSNEFIYIN